MLPWLKQEHKPDQIPSDGSEAGTSGHCRSLACIGATKPYSAISAGTLAGPACGFSSISIISGVAPSHQRRRRGEYPAERATAGRRDVLTTPRCSPTGEVACARRPPITPPNPPRAARRTRANSRILAVTRVVPAPCLHRDQHVIGTDRPCGPLQLRANLGSLDGVRRFERQQGDVATGNEQCDLVLIGLASPVPRRQSSARDRRSSTG